MSFDGLARCVRVCGRATHSPGPASAGSLGDCLWMLLRNLRLMFNVLFW